MYLRSITLFTIIFLMSCSMGDKEKNLNGFDSACLIFQEAATKNLDPEALGNYIAMELDNMDEQPASKDVKAVYHALFNVDPAKRYDLFKESAEITLNRSWDCNAMKELYRE